MEAVRKRMKSAGRMPRELVWNNFLATLNLAWSLLGIYVIIELVLQLLVLLLVPFAGMLYGSAVWEAFWQPTAFWAIIILLVVFVVSGIAGAFISRGWKGL